jgi:hypothetical protein
MWPDAPVTNTFMGRTSEKVMTLGAITLAGPMSLGDIA